MALSIIHIGLPLDHPTIPAEDRPQIEKRLSDLRDRMRAAGYDYEIIHALPGSGLDGFKHRLRTQPCDGVLIGGGVASNPDLAYFRDQIIDATHASAPQAKIMLFSHAEDVLVTVSRALGPMV